MYKWVRQLNGAQKINMILTKSTTNGPDIVPSAATVEAMVIPVLLRDVGNIYKKKCWETIVLYPFFPVIYLDTLDPHDEPADVAGHLGDDVEPHHKVVMGGDKQDGEHQRDRGKNHARAVNPTSPEAICNIENTINEYVVFMCWFSHTALSQN